MGSVHSLAWFFFMKQTHFQNFCSFMIMWWQLWIRTNSACARWIYNCLKNWLFPPISLVNIASNLYSQRACLMSCNINTRKEQRSVLYSYSVIKLWQKDWKLKSLMSALIALKVLVNIVKQSLSWMCLPLSDESLLEASFNFLVHYSLSLCAAYVRIEKDTTAFWVVGWKRRWVARVDFISRRERLPMFWGQPRNDDAKSKSTFMSYMVLLGSSLALWQEKGMSS